MLTVVTDLSSLHRQWFNRSSDMFAVPTENAFQFALEHGIAREQLHNTGIPVSPDIGHEQRSQRTVREELGWQPDLFTVLTVGSVRSARQPDMLRALNHSGLPIQLAVVAGGDNAQHRLYQSIEWHRPTHVFDFVNNLPGMMRAADVVISKAGGLIVSEALAAGLPMVLSDVIPGQETGNADYVTDNGAGVLVQDPLGALEAICHWIGDPELFAQVRSAAARLGRPDAAAHVVKLALALADGRRAQ